MNSIRFPVPRLARQIEQEWSSLLATRFGCTAEEFNVQPEKFMSYPNGTLRVELMDGSEVHLKYAFALISEKWKAIAVFSEHCGHHVFPYHEAKVYHDEQLLFQQAA